jgi:hypothetical protein
VKRPLLAFFSPTYVVRLHLTVSRRLAMSRMHIYRAALVLTSSMAFAPATLAAQQDKIDVTG